VAARRNSVGAVFFLTDDVLRLAIRQKTHRGNSPHVKSVQQRAVVLKAGQFGLACQLADLLVAIQ